MFWIQLLIVLLAIFVGARLGGIGLGVMGGLGLAILTFGFGLQPTAPPIDVMLMIAAVITAAGALQTAGGMDYLVSLAERALRKHPSRITFMGPIVTYLFTFCAGTGHVSYSVLPVIAEVSRQSGVRPERPLSISVIASQQAITASPISAATVALVSLLAGYHISLIDILMISVPATFISCMVAAWVMSKFGKELEDDPIYQERLKEGLIQDTVDANTDQRSASTSPKAKLSVVLFLTGVVLVVLLGSLPQLRPAWENGGKLVPLSMAYAIELVMLSIAALILLVCKVNASHLIKSNVFLAGMQAVISIFGIAWLGDTFFAGHMDQISLWIKDSVTAAPWLFAIALFIMSILLYSQAATVRALMPLGIALGLPPAALIAMFPAVNGYFFIPNYPTVIAAINFDRTGTTRIGKYVLNHSFMLPGLIATTLAIAIGFGLASIIL
ncbi:anaerobic C4-dicarboxylate transporter [Paenibacillus sp. N1-5-1-14]|uniref:anaerobic C4-dicarboxylate transporter family protein n=1 Tax=Paenibacillus radicibacter TaxID=2972488 RepID=UPI0021599054|nr:anaerobic C4-dicarboxylate transporter [Paenibacillus radicibacter]MCR8642764.1 anaerobic C4-dicarboxylate transporter [Paenibacillus radicibacter]